MSTKPTNALRRLLTPRFLCGTKTSKPNHRTRLKITSLEDRVTPATFTVLNDADSGAGSLRQAIVEANAAAGADDIAFDPAFFLTDRVIDLTSGTLAISGSNLTISNPAGPSTVRVNRASGTFGIFSVANTAPLVTIDGLTITGGNAGNAGGISVAGAAVSLTVKNSVISGNTGSLGGAIYIPDGSTGLLTIENSTISGNTGGTGGIYFYYGGSLLVRNSTISGNVGTTNNIYNGGGMVFYGTVGSGGFLIENSTIHGNTTAAATAGGGGINFSEAGGTATIRNSTITGNTAPTAASGGGGIGFTSGTMSLNLINNIIAENTGPTTGPDFRQLTGTVNAQANLFGVVPPSAGGTFNDNGGNLSGSSGSPLSPDLKPLADNGGLTFTRAPNVGSPVLDAGSTAAAGTLTTDQRGLGYSRSFNSAVDIGSFEEQPIGIPSATTNAADIFNANLGELTYSFTVTFGDLTGSNRGVVTSSISNPNNIQVTGPNGFDQYAMAGGISGTLDGTPQTATFTIVVTGGWTLGHNGTYTVRHAGNVSDLDFNPIPIGTIGSFDVLISETFIVTNTTDSAEGSLRAAIIAANSSPAHDFVIFDPSVFGTVPQVITLLDGTGSLSLSAAGGGLTITGPGADMLTVQRDPLATTDFRVIGSLAEVLELSGFTVAGGTDVNASGLSSLGTTTLDHMAFTGNAASGAIGGVYVSGGQTVLITNSVISGNSAGTNGGGLQVGSGADITMINSSVSGNTSTGPGAGIVVFYGGSITMTESTVSDNIAGGAGGGIVVLSGGSATLIESTVSGNSATGPGGGIWIGSGGYLSVLNSTISGNTATTNGGGAYFLNGGTVVIEGSTISGNTTTGVTDSNGGAGLYFFGTGSLTLRNSTIADNVSASSGGGILLHTFTGELLLQNTTVSNNTAQNANSGQGGGGIAKIGTTGFVILQNSIVSGNLATNGTDILATYGSATYSAIGNTADFTFTDGGGNLLDQTFVLGALADNGGPTKTMAPAAGSLLVDAGNDAFVPFGQTTDQLGSTHDRIFGTAVDIGAIEVQPPEVTIEQAVGQADPTNGATITFDIVFDAAVNVAGFNMSDIDLTTFSTVGGTLAGVLTPASLDLFETHFTLAVTGMNGDGLVVPVVKAGGATDASGQVNVASTSIDNEVTFDNVKPAVTIEKSVALAQADPTNNPSITFDVTFSEDVTGFDFSDVETTGSTANIFSVSVIPVTARTYTVNVTLSGGEGDLVVGIPASAAIDAVGNASEMATSTDNMVHYDDVPPTVTVDQLGGLDPVYGSIVQFDVVFSEEVVGFDGSQLSFTGSTATGSFTTSISGTGPAYLVTVSGFTAGGTVIASILAGNVADTAGNTNMASTSTDDTITLINSGTVQFSAPTYLVLENVATKTITVTRVGGTEGVLTVDYAITGGSAINGGVDYTGATSLTLTFADGDATPQDIVITINDDTVFEPLNETVNLALTNVTVDAAAAPGALGAQNTAVLTIDDYEEGTLSFSAPTFTYNEDTGDGTFEITVTRIDGTDGAVGVTYSVTDGMAHLGTDYTAPATANPIAFANGDGATKTIVIPILQELKNEGNETINLGLSAITGGALAGANMTAVGNILPSDGIKIDAASLFKPLLFLDQDGDKVKVSMAGKTGTLELFRTDPDGNDQGPIELITLTGTNPLKSMVTVTVTKAARAVNPTADGKTSIGTVVGTGLKTFTASKSDLVGLGVDVGTDYLGSLTVADVKSGANIISGVGQAAKLKTKLTLGIVEDNVDISVGAGAAAISALSALSFGDGTITAKSADSITIKGRKLTLLMPAVVGNFGADVILNGAVAPAPGKPIPVTLKSLKVAGSVLASSVIAVNGDGKVTTVKVGTAKGLQTDVFAGTFDAASVGTFTVNGNFTGDLTVSGVGVLPGKFSLNSLKVVGSNTAGVVSEGEIDGGTIRVGTNQVAGNINTVSAVKFLNSTLFAGYSGMTDGMGVFNTGVVNSFTTTALADSFANSNVIASTFKKVTLKSVDTTNDLIPFGFIANDALTSLKVTTPLLTFVTADGTKTVDQFTVKVRSIP